MASNSNNSVKLNNLLQGMGKDSSLSWQDTFTGERHNGTWTSSCKIDGEVIATGTGPQKHIARDAAARIALTLISPDN
ncbi:hypothetical protein C8Q80DRAFT_1264585 [Daedaleopsis nitida]|nr:hypothetical protein C8Q80DRAFT_1264585 [Daedaleopsis nitida]